MPTQYIEHPETKERIPFEWDKPEPPTPADIESLLKAVTVKPGKSIGGFISNIGTNVGEVAKGLATVVTRPIQTAGTIGTLAGQTIRGGLEKLTGEPTGTEAQTTFEKVTEPIAESIRNPSGMPGRILNYAYKKPVETAMMVSGVTGLGGKVAEAGGLARTATAFKTAAKVTDPLTLPFMIGKPVAGAVRKIAKETTGALTGGGPGFIEESAKGIPAYQKAIRGKITGEEVVSHAKDAVQNLRDQAGSTYLKELGNVRANPGVFNQVKAGLDRELSTLMGRDEFHIGTITTPTGATKLDFTQSPLVKGQAVVKKAIGDVMGWQDNTALGLDNLKKRLSKYIDQVEKRSPSEALLTRLEKNLNNGLKGAIPEYEAMTRGYAEWNSLIRDIESNLMIRKEGMSGRITADNTLRRLSSALKEPFEMRKDLLRVLGEKSGMDIPAEVAGYIGRQWIPRGAWGKVLAGSGAYFLKAINPQFWPIILASSPRVVGEFLNAYGKAMNKVGPTLEMGAKIATSPEVLFPVSLAGRTPEQSAGGISGLPSGIGMRKEQPTPVIREPEPVQTGGVTALPSQDPYQKSLNDAREAISQGADPVEVGKRFKIRWNKEIQ